MRLIDRNALEWTRYFLRLEEQDIAWRVQWMDRWPFLYHCGRKMWVPLMGSRFGVSYTLTLVQRQFLMAQFVPYTEGFYELDIEVPGP